MQAVTENRMMNVAIHKQHELLSRIEIDESFRDGRDEKYHTSENLKKWMRSFKIKSVLK